MTNSAAMFLLMRNNQYNLQHHYAPPPPTAEEIVQREIDQESKRLVAFGSHRELLSKVNTSSFEDLAKQIPVLPSLDYPIQKYIISNQWPIPLNDSNNCLADLFLVHPNLTNPQKIELVENLFKLNPAYTDILYKDSVMDILLGNADFHPLLKRLYLAACSVRPWFNFKPQYENKIWDLFIQYNEDLGKYFQPLFAIINADYTNNFYYLNYKNTARSRLLRFAIYWLNLSKTSTEVMDTYNKIKKLFSTCDPLKKYLSNIHKMAEILVNRLQVDAKIDKSEKDKIWSFLEKERRGLFSCRKKNTRGQILYQQISNNESKAIENLDNEAIAVETRLNEKFKNKYGFETKIKRF